MTTNNENAPEIQPMPWRRPRRIGTFNRAAQLIFAAANWWQNVPKPSILKQPGNAFTPRPLTEDEFKPGPLADAKVIQKFKDRRDVHYVRLNRGTIVRAEAKVESADRRHKNEVANRPTFLRNVRHTIDAARMALSVKSVAVPVKSV